MKPTSAALVLAMAVLGKCDNQSSSTFTSAVSSVRSLDSTPYPTGTSELVPAGPSGSAITSQAPGPVSPISDTARTEAPDMADAGATNLTSALDLSGEAHRQRHRGDVTDEQVEQAEKELGGELHRDKNGNRTPISFGMEGLLTHFNKALWNRFVWPSLPDKGNPITDSPAEFMDTECTGMDIDLFEERRAARHLEYFCNRFVLPPQNLYASTSGKTTLYMCPYSGTRNCSLALWQAARAHLDSKCGIGRSGWVHLRKLRIGRAPVDGERVILCEGLRYAPLFEYRINQRPALVDGMPYEDWRIVNRRNQMRKELLPKDINEGNDADP